MSWLTTQTMLLDSASAAAGFACNWLLQSTLLIAAGLLLGRIARRRGAAVQSVVYRTTLVAVLVCPLATSLLARANFAAALAAGQLWNPSREPPLWALVERYDAGNNLDEAVAWFATLFWGSAPPEIVAEIASAAEATSSDHRLSAAVSLILARPESQLM